MIGAVAQLGERIVRNDEVGGSNPPSSTNRRHPAVNFSETGGAKLDA